MKICILSDSHDFREPLQQAIEEAMDWGAEAILHAGDVVSAYTLRILFKYDIPIHAIHGNNAGDIPILSKISHDPANKVHYYGQDAALELGGRKIFLVHYPHYAEGLALTGDWDLVCCGHDHKLHIEEHTNIKGGTTWLVNPGTVAGIGGAPATYVLCDLETMSFEPRTLEL